ncbi:MAG TPA: glutamate 5-kinase [Rhizomicrobium sp.]|jgi:glutamate 5-kinase|nr:glutamate 5-kinase [Rhizomicrobium sp.]
MSDPLADSKRIVVKIGSALLVERETGRLRQSWLASICADLVALKREGREIVVVSSGAIALGRNTLGLHKGVLKLEESQAAAAVGQIRLAQAYAEALAGEHLLAAQILLTLGDTEERARYLNARATLRTLLSLGSVPIINENDTVATTEIRFGDNDRLAARVASMTEADCLVLLSDVDGLYTRDPTRDRDARHVPVVEEITADIEAMAGESLSGLGRGGMASKLIAAKIATQAGCRVVVGRGAGEHPLADIRGGARITRFAARATPRAARKRWIAGGLQARGALFVDAGAAKALMQGRSLLPAGVARVDGDFARGDAVRVCDEKGRELARGLVAYGTADAQRIKGRKSSDIESILGYRGRDEMIHRDDLALTAEGTNVG